ncbi:nucleoside-diphosphate kinase [Bacillus salipaludis]|uniref:nucleoside-diphosphate kinase n=1 Tax=Bacillus salipaludis TaxID=2547811 RepID=A0AA90R6K6_9BACI|nr:nucleoside-diphosphate kinase [Bacillus salipaludis]MDQ6596421.1 nucleoside-diphosphate kinase [Bacillus salipaludis]
MNWENLGFVICKPDAVYLHLEQEILSFLQRKGFKILTCKYVTVTPDLCRLLYWNEGNLEWWHELEAEFYNLGESLCVLVQGTPKPPYKSVSELIVKKLKGNFRPEKAKEGTVRNTFGSINGIFNLFHAADCTSATKREAALFFTTEELERLTYQGTPYFLKQKEKHNLDFIEMYFRIKQQCIQISSMNPGVKKRYKKFIDEKHIQSISVSNSMKQIWLYKTLQEEYQMFYKDIRKDKLLMSITDYKHFKRIKFDELFREFVTVSINLTRWETCLFKTSLLLAGKFSKP